MRSKQNGGFYLYIPMVLTAAFLMGCLGVALVFVRENVGGLTVGASVSQSDGAGREQVIRRSAVRESGSLRYRMVSASDVYTLRPVSSAPEELPAASQTASSDAVSSDAVSSDAVSSDAVSSDAVSPDAVSSDAVSSDAVSPDAVSSDAVSPDAVSSDAVSPDTVSSDAKPQTLSLPNDHYINFIPPKEDHVAYLTFDDGPSIYTDEILNILDYYNVKATFFVVYHKNMEAQYKAIVDRGHTIALHTYSHKYNKVYRSEAAFFNELNMISNYIYSLTGVRSKIIRFPGGSSNTVSNHYCQDIMQKLKKSVPARGYVYHDWNVDSTDAEGVNRDPAKLLANVQKNLTVYRKPDILMHDSGEEKRTTVEALPAIIEYIYSQGYKMERLTLDSYAVHHNW